MSVFDDVRAQLQRVSSALQSYAIAYFQAVYETVINFWSMKNIPAGANILTGAFGAILISLARFERSLPGSPQDLVTVFAITYLYVLFVCGISLLADPALENHIDNFKKLVSLVSVQTSLACGLIALSWVVPWTWPIEALSHKLGLFDVGANRVVSVGAAFAATVLILLRTIRQRPKGIRHILLWSLASFAIVSIGTSLILLDI